LEILVAPETAFTTSHPLTQQRSSCGKVFAIFRLRIAMHVRLDIRKDIGEIEHWQIDELEMPPDVADIDFTALS
jgi:hypothetical protein